MYIGGGPNSSNLIAYLDGCTFENEGHRAIVLRGTDEEQNNTINISNSTIDETIRIDNDTLRVNVGVGTNITESTFDDASRATWTSELYRKNPVDKALNNNDFEALKKYIEPQYELIETVEITAENTAAVVMKHKLDKFALYIKTPVADAALSCGVQVSKGSTIVGYAWLDGMVGTEARRCTVFGRNENGISYIENTKPQKLTDAIESTITLLRQSRLAEGNTSYDQIRVFGSSGNAMPIGTTFELWGVKA